METSAASWQSASTRDVLWLGDDEEPLSDEEDLDEDELRHQATWRSSNQRAFRWRGRPKTSLEKTLRRTQSNEHRMLPDPVTAPVRAPKRYESNPHSWQSVGTTWENSQRRPLTSTVSTSILPHSSEDLSLTKRSGNVPGYSGHLSDTWPRRRSVTSLLLPRLPPAPSSSSYNMPGYTGHIPQSANNLELSGPRQHRPTETTSSAMAATLKKAGWQARPNENFARNGMFSRSITLTQPHCPYNLSGSIGSTDLKPRVQRDIWRKATF